ncbi:MAG: hypothetical protein ACREDL_17270, partial [Bradyrhizobium sp.]
DAMSTGNPAAMTEFDSQITLSICDHISLMRELIAEAQPSLVADQRHHDLGTLECAYWRFGYEAALNNIMDYLGALDVAGDLAGLSPGSASDAKDARPAAV